MHNVMKGYEPLIIFCPCPFLRYYKQGPPAAFTPLVWLATIYAAASRGSSFHPPLAVAFLLHPPLAAAFPPSPPSGRRIPSFIPHWPQPRLFTPPWPQLLSFTSSGSSLPTFTPPWPQPFLFTLPWPQPRISEMFVFMD